MQEPLCFEINKKEFVELTRDIYNNQDNNDFKLSWTKELMIWKTQKKIWTEVTTRKTTINEAKKLYNELV